MFDDYKDIILEKIGSPTFWTYLFVFFAISCGPLMFGKKNLTWSFGFALWLFVTNVTVLLVIGWFSSGEYFLTSLASVGVILEIIFPIIIVIIVRTRKS